MSGRFGNKGGKGKGKGCFPHPPEVAPPPHLAQQHPIAAGSFWHTCSQLIRRFGHFLGRICSEAPVEVKQALLNAWSESFQEGLVDGFPHYNAEV